MDRPTLDRYALEDELGQGGMSVVYRARDAQLRREVAVKILHRYLARQPEARRRLHREAMAVARLRHRAIVEIYDYSGPDAEDAYIVCELIDGPTLREFVDARSTPGPEVALLVGLELCEALAHAHACGIVHRDLKPENVMITPEGQLKLMDFGIAQVLEGHTRLTATGTLVGSPAHMAPEVIDGKPTDHRADIFSLGTMLYWLAVGELPFTAPHPSALFKKILDGDFTPADVACPRVGRRTARLIARCLARAPEDRPATAEDLARDLRAELATLDLDTTGARLGALLANPETELPALEAHVVDVLAVAARDAAARRDWATAADAVNRILARRPDHPEARALLERLARGERRTLLLRRTAAAVLPLTLAGVALAVARDRRPRPPAPPAVRSTLTPPVDAGGPGLAPAPATVRPAGPGSDRGAELTRSRPADPTPARRRAGGAPERPRASATAARLTAARASEDGGPRGPSVPPTPQSAGAQAAGPDAGRTESEVVRLTVQVGRGYADVWVDDELVLELSFFGEVELSPGRHSVEVVRDRAKILARLGVDEEPRDRPFPQFGRFAPRDILIEEDGRIFELGPEGRRELKDGVLRFSIPTSPGEANRIDSWISS